MLFIDRVFQIRLKTIEDLKLTVVDEVTAVYVVQTFLNWIVQ